MRQPIFCYWEISQLPQQRVGLGGTCEDNIAGQVGEIFACEHGFDQLVTEATRVYTYRGVQKESVLDLCLTDVPYLLSFTGNLSNIGYSDHKLVSLVSEGA